MHRGGSVDFFNKNLLVTKTLTNRIPTSAFVTHPALLLIEPTKFPILETFYRYNSPECFESENVGRVFVEAVVGKYPNQSNYPLTKFFKLRNLYYRRVMGGLVCPNLRENHSGRLYASRGGKFAHFTEIRYLLSLVGRYFSRQMNASLSKNRLIGNSRFKLFAFHFSFKKYLSTLVHRGYFIDNQFDWFDSA